MKLSLTGCKSNAERQLSAIVESCDLPEDETETGFIEVCISAYHDCLLALLKGDSTLDEMRDFLLYKKTPEEIAETPYCGKILLMDSAGKSCK